MKYCIFFISMFSLIMSVDAAGLQKSKNLKPNLSVQMQKNEVQLKQVIKSEQAQANKNRLEENKRKRITSTSTRNTNTDTVTRTMSSTSTTNNAPSSQTPKSETRYHSSGQSNIPNVDMERVRSTWIGWYNNTRSNLWLTPYSYNSRLDQTAADWNSIFAAGKWQNHHTRTAGDGYYNFNKIDEWFKNRGVDPIATHGVKHSENVGYGSYSCNQSDCTDELIESIRTTYRFFMNSRTHYPSLVQPHFTKIGMNIITVPSEGRYYLTVHYITQ